MQDQDMAIEMDDAVFAAFKKSTNISGKLKIPSLTFKISFL